MSESSIKLVQSEDDDGRGGEIHRGACFTLLAEQVNEGGLEWDCILLAAYQHDGTPSSEVYVQMDAFDPGDNKLIVKQCVLDLTSHTHIGQLLEEEGGLYLTGVPLENSCDPAFEFRGSITRGVDANESLAASVGNRNVVCAGSKLRLVDRVTLLAVYGPPCTQLTLLGAEGAAQRTKKRVDAKNKADVERREREKERKERVEAQYCDLDTCIALLHTATGVAWADRLTDVPDDGNCLLHCVWSGIRAYMACVRPASVSEEVTARVGDIGADPAAFRAIFFTRVLQEPLKSKLNYAGDVLGMLRFYLTLDFDVLTNLPDFFVLPERIRIKLVQVREVFTLQQGAEAEAAEVDVDVDEGGMRVEVVDVEEELEALTAILIEYSVSPLAREKGESREHDVYVPLGHLELRALSEVFGLRVEIMTGDHNTLDADFDPRGVQSRYIQTMKPTRITHSHASIPIRIMNLNENHYNVHLPSRGESAAES
jgi:hypothetical protein